MLDHRGEGKNRDCQKQTDPEALPEIRHHLAVIVPGMVAVARMRAMIVMSRACAGDTPLPRYPIDYLA